MAPARAPGRGELTCSNVRIPPAVDRVLRWFVATPDMHRVHHSVLLAETDSNSWAVAGNRGLFLTYPRETDTMHRICNAGHL